MLLIWGAVGYWTAKQIAVQLEVLKKKSAFASATLAKMCASVICLDLSPSRVKSFS